jgi:hypothetical protein
MEKHYSSNKSSVSGIRKDYLENKYFIPNPYAGLTICFHRWFHVYERLKLDQT